MPSLPHSSAPVQRMLAAMLALACLLAWTPRAQAQGHDPDQLDVPGSAPAWYFAPKNKKARMVLVWMHGRGGNPHDDCKKWSNVASGFGWLLCPSGQEDYGGGARAWNNDWPGAQRQVDNALEALRKKFPTIQRYGHVLIGFSEGAYAAQNIGVREPRVFNRWLILASAARYWGGEGLEILKNNRAAIKRVYLLTGALDAPVLDESKEAYETLKKNKVHTRLRIVHDIGHEVPASRMRELYQQPLQWLVHNR
jgi:predicted esterase